MKPEPYWKQPEQLQLLAEIGPVEWEGVEGEACKLTAIIGSWVGCSWSVNCCGIDDYTAVAIIRRWLQEWLEQHDTLDTYDDTLDVFLVKRVLQEDKEDEAAAIEKADNEKAKSANS